MNLETDIATCDLLDRHPELACTEMQFRDLGGQRRFSGRIRTLKCVDDTKLLAQVLAEPGEGGVLVVDGEASPRCALIGDRHAGTAARNGWKGVVVYGMARDSVGLGAVDIGVKVLGVVPRRSGKTGRGEIDVPVTFGGVTFVPGGRLWADEDGVIVAPPEWAPRST